MQLVTLPIHKDAAITFLNNTRITRDQHDGPAIYGAARQV